MANPLTAHYGIAHGQAVGTVLPTVARFNAHDPAIAGVYAELARAARLSPPDAADAEAVEALVARLRSLLETAGFATSLADHGVADTAVDDLAREAAEQWTARFNPRVVTAAEFRGLFAAACRDAR